MEQRSERPIALQDRAVNGADHSRRSTVITGRGTREAGRLVSLPVHRAIVVVDIESSTSRTNPVKEELRREVYRLVGEAMRVAGIEPGHCDRPMDRGDGVLLLIHPVDEVPKPLLINPFAPALSGLLARYNAGLPAGERPGRRLRLRAAIHAGEVHFDENGAFGEALDVACRLLDAPRLKLRLRQASGPLVLVVSEEIYWSVIRHEYGGIDVRNFQQAMSVRVAGRRRRGWVCAPAGAYDKEPLPTRRPAEAPLR